MTVFALVTDDSEGVNLRLYARESDMQDEYVRYANKNSETLMKSNILDFEDNFEFVCEHGLDDGAHIHWFEETIHENE